MISIKNTGQLRIKNIFLYFHIASIILVQYFKNNILTEKMIFNLSAHLIVFENIKQYF